MRLPTKCLCTLVFILPSFSGWAAWSDKVEPSRYDFGGIGLIQMPSARMAPDGDISFNYARIDPYVFGAVNLQPLPCQNAKNNFGVQENYIEIELLENSSIEFNESFKDGLMELRNLGYKISIDDFGKGNSNIYHLINIPITTIKLDRLFCNGVDNVKIVQLLKTVIKMANILGLDVVAEGIENEEHLSMFKELGCHLGQGYYLGHPSRLIK